MIYHTHVNKPYSLHPFHITFSYILGCFPCCRSIGDIPSRDNIDDKIGPGFRMDMSCQSNVNGDVPVCSTSVNISHPHQSFCGYVQQPAFVSGWMYVNEQGKMCGPYIKEQLYEGLTTGFLPFELPVYPVISGTIMNPVPLNYFKQFPDHVSTGFAYLSMDMSGTRIPTNCPSSSKDMGINGQDRSFEQAALLAVNPDSNSVSQSHNNYCVKESNHLYSNSEVLNRIISCQMEVQYLLSVLLNISLFDIPLTSFDSCVLFLSSVWRRVLLAL